MRGAGCGAAALVVLVLAAGVSMCYAFWLALLSSAIGTPSLRPASLSIRVRSGRVLCGPGLRGWKGGRWWWGGELAGRGYGADHSADHRERTAGCRTRGAWWGRALVGLAACGVPRGKRGRKIATDRIAYRSCLAAVGGYITFHFYIWACATWVGPRAACDN
jgi:hypothetical protein